MDGGLPILIRTDEQLVAVHSNDPGYAEVEPMPFAYVHQDAVPHVDTIERFAASDVEGTTTDDATTDRSDETDDDAESTADDSTTDDAPTIEGGVSP